MIRTQKSVDVSRRRASGTAWVWLLLALVVGGVAGRAGQQQFPEYQTLAAGRMQPVLLPGQKQFVFTLYGVPSDADSLRRLVRVMQEKDLGNGFDPGPSARASNRAAFEYLATVGWPVMAYPGCGDMQVKGGCALGTDDLAALSPVDQAGVFNAVQLGE